MKGHEYLEIETRKISAVGAIITAEDGRILVVQETQDKPVFDKRCGDWSFPAETLKEGEAVFEALSRLISEEVGDIRFSFDSTEDWIGDYNVGSQEKPIWGRVFLLYAKGRSEELIDLYSIDGEVINHRWIFPMGLQGMARRKGVWEPLKDFLGYERRMGR